MERGAGKGGGGTRWGLPDEARAQSPRTDEELQRLNGGRLNGVKSGGETFSVTAVVQQETGDKLQGGACLMGGAQFYAASLFCFIQMMLIKASLQGTHGKK